MSKTYLDDLLDKYPHCMILDSGCPRICRSVLYEGKYCDGSLGYDCFNCWYEEMQEDAPAVPHEMSARELFNAYQRICEEYSHKGIPVRCDECPLYTICPEIGKALRVMVIWSHIIERWAQEHPERSEE